LLTERIMPRFAANLGYLFTERPLIERFAAAAAAGFAAVELQFPYDVAPASVKAELARHRLAALGINTPLDPQFGLAALPGREREFDAAFKRALDYVASIGGTAIHCMSGVVPVEQRPAAETVFIKNLTRAAEQAARQNITVLIEPINPRDRAGYFLSHLEHAAAIVQKVGAPNLRIQFDVYHVQIAAVPSRREPDEGEVNFAEIFAALDRLGYAGWIGCEYRPRARTEEGLVWARPYGVVPKGR
jgi:hydroxypyruvate isomerase